MSMESFLREHGVPMVRPGSVLDSREDQGKRWTSDHAGRVHEPQSGPRMTAPLGYPVQTEPVDEDRRARGAREPALSDRLRGLAQEVERLAAAASDGRQRGRLRSYGARLRAMASRQYSRELENDVAPVGDGADAELNGLADDAARDTDRPAQDAYNGGEIKSFDDWADEDRAGSEQRAEDDVADQRAELDFGEDVPQGLPPRPGRRIDEDQVPPENIQDEPQGLRRNRADDDVLQRVRKGRRSGLGSHSTGRPGQRYSAFGKESLRESDLTAMLLEDQAINYFGSHGSW